VERGAPLPLFALVVVSSRVIVLRLACASVVLAALALACSETDCDLAEDKIHDCGIDNAALTGAGVDCGERAACEAKCVQGASCVEIEAVLAKGETNELSDCVSACATPNVEPG
jgi:hypothetical protein